MGLRFANQSFWVGASDLEAEGTFRWFYSGDQFSQDLWAREEPDNKNNKEHCVQLNQDYLKFSDANCEQVGYYICQYMPEIYVPLDDNSISAEGKARSFDTLNPNSHYSQICGRKFVRNGRIVGGGVANYAEWPWQVRDYCKACLEGTKYAQLFEFSKSYNPYFLHRSP